MAEYSLAIPIDHVGIVGRQIDQMVATFAKLGFDAPNGVTDLEVGIGDGRKASQNTHFVFDAGYIELIASDGTDHLRNYIKRNEGLHIMAMASHHIQAAYASMEQASLAPQAVLHSSRRAAHGKRTGTGKFAWFTFAEDRFPEGLVCVTEHLTPELIYQPERFVQPNGALALGEVFLLSEEPLAAVARYQALSYENCHVDSKTGIRHICNRLTILDRPGAERKFPGLDTSIRNGLLGLAIKVEDRQRIEGLLDQAGISWQTTAESRLWVSPADAGGCVLVFDE